MEQAQTIQSVQNPMCLIVRGNVFVPYIGLSILC